MATKKFEYGMDPDDREDTPEDLRRMRSMQFHFWKNSKVKPEEIEDKEKSAAYAQYLKDGTL